MSATPLMSLGMRAMASSYAALQVTGHNIANANVEGYSRQRVELATAEGQFTGAGFFGKGSDVESVVRLHDEFLTRELAATTALASMDDARLEQLRKLEGVFRTGEQGLGYATLDFLNSFSDLASNPADSSARQVVLARAEEMAARFGDAGAQIEDMQQLLRADLATSVQSVNGLSASVADVNRQIAALQGMGQPPNDLLDRRDQLVAELSRELRVTTVQASDGTLGVFAGGGQALVLGAQASTLQMVDDPADPARAAIGLNTPVGVVQLPSQSIGGGRIAGLLQVQNGDLEQAQLLIGQLAAAVAGAVNAQQVLGMNLHEPYGSIAAQPLFAVGAPTVQPNAHNARAADSSFLANPTLTITSPGELQASEYALVADPSGLPGQWQLTRLSDGTVRTVVDGDEVDGFRIDLGTPLPAATDRFLLQPVTHAALDMAVLLRDPRDLAAASSLTATVGAANTGTMAVSGLTIASDAADPQVTAGITFTDDIGSYAWELRDRDSNALVASGTGSWNAGDTLPGASIDINGFQVTLTGVPRVGDTLTVEKTIDPTTHNGNALALAALRDQPLVGRTRLSDGTLSGGATSTDAYASAMADIGVRVQGAQTLADISTSLRDTAAQAVSDETGVNLDEEAATLLQFQQSYQAAAKVLQVAQQIFDTLLQTTSG